jgi:predicted transposase YbfD/YdcC
MELANSLIDSAGIIIVAAIGFLTVVYQVRKGREENSRDHGAVMEKLGEVASEIKILDQDLGVIEAKLDAHMTDEKAHRRSKPGKNK